jgi:lysophospholipase L1-like esterase
LREQNHARQVHHPPHQPGLPELSSAAVAAPVVVFGDSWAELGADELGQALAAAGYTQYTVYNNGVSGSTAQRWAVDNPMAMSNAVFANPDARWVWLSIGGNDIQQLHEAGQGALAGARNDQNIRTMLTNFFVFHPDVRVVAFAYDIVNFAQSQMCIDLASTYFYAGISHREISQIFLRDIGAVLGTLAPDYEGFTYVPLTGTLQRAGGVVGAPDLDQPSPANLMEDCIHPNTTGFRALADALVAAYWDVPEPTVTISPQIPSGCVGDRVTLTAQATDADRYRWLVNGNLVGTERVLSLVLNAPGALTVEVRVINQAYTDLASQVINVGSCVDAGFPDQGFPDTGVPDAFLPDEGFVDGGIWPDAEVPDSGVVDTGALVDLGFVDSGVGRPDTGLVGLDAGLSKPMVAGEWSLGGGCRAVPGAARGGVAWGLLCALAWLISASSSSPCRRPPLRRP